jgi:hypothetical protein
MKLLLKVTTDKDITWLIVTNRANHKVLNACSYFGCCHHFIKVISFILQQCNHIIGFNCIKSTCIQELKAPWIFVSAISVT